jgi:hypothetical protein
VTLSLENLSIDFFPLVKGIVRRKLRWVKSGINQLLIDCHLAADVLLSNLKGHHPLNLIKPVSAGTGIVN